MFNTLRNRLLLSFGAILLIMLILIGLTLLVFLRTRPLPTDDIVRDLAATLLDVQVSESWRITANTDDLTWSPGQTEVPLAVIERQITTYLDDQAAARDVRTLVVRGSGQVEFDSAGVFQKGELIPRFDRKSLVPANVPRPLLTEVIQGRFTDPDGAEWIYVAQPLLPFNMLFEMAQSGMTRPREMMATASVFAVVAQPAPQATLREVFRIFGSTFLVPLARAGLIGLLVAFALSVLIARSVARPLQHISRAARRLAGGDTRQRVPVQGPREVKALAASFNEMVTRVAISQQAQRDFLANVSHDLRTPLTSIQGFSQAIMEGVAADPESAQRAAQIIHDEAARLHRMVEDLLDMARIEAGRLDMLRHAVQIGGLLQAVGDSLSVRAQEQGLMFERDIPPDLPRIAGDGDRLAQVFTNLLDNAIKHTPAGGTVCLSAETDPGGVLVTIRDTGEGIPPEDLSRVFERFYQVDKSRQRRQRSGAGLGLAITRQIVEAHGGIIQVASKIGEGTAFTVRLPLPGPDMTTVAQRAR